LTSSRRSRRTSSSRASAAVRLRQHQPRLHPAQPRHSGGRPGRLPHQLLRRVHDAHGVREGLRRGHAEDCTATLSEEEQRLAVERTTLCSRARWTTTSSWPSWPGEGSRHAGPRLRSVTPKVLRHRGGLHVAHAIHLTKSLLKGRSPKPRVSSVRKASSVESTNRQTATVA